MIFDLKICQVSNEVGIWTGTKQGDQISPILFNLSMDAVTV